MNWSIRSCVDRVAAEFDPDIILGSWAYPDGFAAVRLARRLNIPAAVHVLGSDLNLLDRYRSRRRATWKTLHAAQGIITSSCDLADKVVAHGIERARVTIVYRGVDCDRFCPGSQSQARLELGLADSDPVLLFVGNLVPVKAVDILISACAKLVSQFPRMRCHIIGDGPLRQQLEAQARTLSISPVIRFQGTVPHNELPAWYRAANLLVLPSLAEGVPNVLRESIACGLPYVASATGGIPEISNHSACTLVPPGKSSALANAIADRLRGASMPVDAGMNTDSWDEAGRKLGQVLESIQRSGRRSVAGNQSNRSETHDQCAA